jgi:hypothetical protein
MARSGRRVENNEVLIWKKRLSVSPYRSLAQARIVEKWYYVFVIIAIILIGERLTVSIYSIG